MTTKMFRLFSRGILLAGLAFLLQGTLGLDGTVQGEQPGAKPAEYLYVPGYWTLSRKDTQKEIGLTEEQLAKLKEISKEFMGVTRKPYPQIDWAKLSEAERKQKIEEMTRESQKMMEEYKKRSAEAQKKAEAILTRDQLKKLEMIELRAYAPSFLLYGQGKDKLDLTPEQKEKLKKSQEEMQKRMTELQQKMTQAQDKANRAALEILTPEQIEKLKKMRKEATLWQGQPSGAGRGGLYIAPREVPKGKVEVPKGRVEVPKGGKK